jgi:hypothetical protein
MALFGGMFGGGGQKHPNLDRLSQSIQNNLGLQIAPPSEDALAAIDTLTSRNLIDIQNAFSIEAVQDLLMHNSLRATVDPPTQTMVLSVASREQIESELKSEHTAVKVMHVGSSHGTSKIIHSFGPAPEPVKVELPGATAQEQAVMAEAIAAPPGFEHLEAAERLCPAVVDLFVKHGQLTTADKEVLKKIHPVDSSLEARMVALERWKTEITRRSRGIRVREGGPTSLLSSSSIEQSSATGFSEDAVLRRFDAFLHWLSKLIKAYEGKGIKFHGKPVWLPH